ncbi:hypothetical protein BSKO_05111 [Bryopsis sp. KO-2023]|nr:hypothetical protein BSKO_05111 [Bryopsis sp. KO-2023]
MHANRVRIPAASIPAARGTHRNGNPGRCHCLGNHGFKEAERRDPTGPIILGIESSCDDTGVAIVNSDGRILGEALATQVEVHAPWGGVVPDLARQAHQAAIDGLVKRVVGESGIDPRELSGVAVTIGPGLSLCLKVGALKARSFAYEHSLPLVPVHHMEAHALVARMTDRHRTEYPFLCMLASGGHNLLLVVHSVGRYTQIGTTLDDSLGEAYDKVARLLGLELNPSGGAALEALALEGDPDSFDFKVPMLQHRDCNFSYSGLKTSVRLAIDREVKGEPSEANRQARANIAASFQRVAILHLEHRCKRACEWANEVYPEIDTLVMSGGVAANSYVRARLEEVASKHQMQLLCPEPRLCTDNGVMVAWAGLERFKLGLVDPPPESPAPEEDEWFDLRPRWPLTERVAFQLTRSTPNYSNRKRVYRSLTAMTEDSLNMAGMNAGPAMNIP